VIPKTLSMNVPRWAQFAATFVAGALVATLAFAEIGPIRLHPPGRDSISTTRVEQVTDNGPAAGPQASAAAGPGASGPGTAQALAKSGLKCQAGANGGSTDVGVTGSTIKLATTEVESGIGAAFLGQVEQNTRGRPAYFPQRKLELGAAVASQRSQNVAGEALGMHTNKGRSVLSKGAAKVATDQRDRFILRSTAG